MITINMTGWHIPVLISLFISFLIDHPAASYFAGKLLGMISTLATITHFVLINVNYPQNLQEFMSYIFPLITFGLFSPDYEGIFRISEFEDGLLERFSEV